MWVLMVDLNVYFVGCPQNGAQFFGSRGMIVEGEVSPPLVGVTIKIQTEGYNPVVVETNEKGQYT